MQERSGILKEYENNFKITEPHIRKLYNILKTYAEQLNDGAHVSIYVERENDSYIETTDLEKVLQEENISGKLITNLNMKIICDKKDNSSKNNPMCILGFDQKRQVKITFMTSNENRDWCFLLFDELDGQVQRILLQKPIKKNIISFMNTIAALSMLIIPFIVIFLYSNNWKTGRAAADNITTKSIDQKLNYLIEKSFVNLESLIPILFFLFCSLVAFFLILEFKPISKLLNLGQVSVFYWGDITESYDKRLAKLSRFKWGIIIAFIVSLAATFVGSLFIK